MLHDSIYEAGFGELLHARTISETPTGVAVNDTMKVSQSMANVKLVSANDRSYPDSAMDRSVWAVRTNKPVVEQWARGCLAHCLLQVIATPHLVAVHALEATTVIVVSQLNTMDRSEKMSKLFHFLDQCLGAYAEEGRWLDLVPLAELMAGNSKKAMKVEVAAGIYFIDMRLPAGCR